MRFQRGKALLIGALASGRSILMASLIALLPACGGGGGGSGGGISGETINSIAVPPTPDGTTNQATVAGVDSNGNGIRDDVDRMLATEFGRSASAHQEAVRYARTLQTALTSPTPENVEQHISLLRCVRDPQKLADLKKVTLATLDAPIRRGAYSTTFTGIVLTNKGCPK